MKNFNPEKTNSYEEIPEEEKHKFEKVEGGFVKKEALSYEEAAKRSKRIKKILQRDSVNKYTPNYYEEAELEVESEIEEDEKLSEILHRAARGTGYLKSLEEKPKNINLEVFKRRYPKLFWRKSYRYLHNDTRERFLKLGKQYIKESDYSGQLNTLKAWEEFDFKSEVDKDLKDKFIQDGSYELYVSLQSVQDKEIKESELKVLGKNALDKNYHSDALKAFRAVNEANLEKEANELREKQIEQAQEKKEKMPDGFMTKKLMSHFTARENLPDILDEGILSNTEMRKRHEEAVSGLGNDLQTRFGMFDHISVHDPWLGYGTHEKHKSISSSVRSKVAGFKARKATRIDNWKELTEEERQEIISESPVYMRPKRKEYRYGELVSCSNFLPKVNEELAADPEHQDVFDELEKLYIETYEEYADFDEPDQPVFHQDSNVFKYDEGEEINPKEVFNEEKSSRVRLMINPEIERVPVLGSGYGLESFVKKQVPSEDIIGIVISEYSSENEGAHEHCKRLAERSGTPLYISKKSKEGETTKYEYDEVWPNED